MQRSHDLYEMELIGEDHFLAAVPIDADQDLKRKLLGAIKSHFLGLRSVDHTIKRYGERWSFPGPTADQLFVVSTLRAIDHKVQSLVRAITTGSPRPDQIGLLSSEVALVRLEATFRSALLLLSRAHAFEASAVIRLALEQVAWAYAAAQCISRSDVLSVSPTRAITPLQAIAPCAGRLYGALSTQAHLDPTISETYYEAAEGGVVSIRHQLADESYVALAHLLVVTILFELVLRNILGAYIDYPPPQGYPARDWNGSASIANALRTLKAKYNLEWLPCTVVSDGVFTIS
jgi:hypothetical protein